MAGERLALVVAVDDYEHEALTRLSAPTADAEALAAVLADPDLGGFSVTTLVNATASATVERIEEFLGDRRSDDLALLHFSCHGLKDDHGELYLAAHNTNPVRLASTAVDAALVDRLMRRSRAQRIVLLLDCCYGGAFERGAVARAGGSVGVDEHFHQDALAGGRGRIVITASTAMEYAFEGRRLTDGQSRTPSVFTAAVVDGIRSGEADRDADGQIGIGELYDFVHDRVRAGSPQTPCKWEYGSQGALVVARAPRRRVRLGRLPLELEELVQHPYPAVRRSGVEELLRLAQGEDLSAAVAARAALSGLADDDSRAVSAAAASALTASELRLSPSTVAFGELPHGQVVSPITVDLHGPPLVVTAEVVDLPAGLTARVRDRSLELCVDTDVERSLDGTLLVTSAAGEARLEVAGSVGAAALEGAVGPPAAHDVAPARRSRRRHVPESPQGAPVEPAPSACTAGPPVLEADVPDQRSAHAPGGDERPHRASDAVVRRVALTVLAGSLVLLTATFVVPDWDGTSQRVGFALGLLAACTAGLVLPPPSSTRGQAAVRAGCWAAAALSAMFLLRDVVALSGSGSTLPRQLTGHVALAVLLLVVTAASGLLERQPRWGRPVQLLQVCAAAGLATSLLLDEEPGLNAEGAGVPVVLATVLASIGLRSRAPRHEPATVELEVDRRPGVERLAGVALALSVAFLVWALLRQDVDQAWFYGQATGIWGGWSTEYVVALGLGCAAATLLRPPGPAAATGLHAARSVCAAVALVFVLGLAADDPDDGPLNAVLLATVLLTAATTAAALAARGQAFGPRVALVLDVTSLLSATGVVAFGLHRALGYFWYPQITAAATAAAVLAAVGLVRRGTSGAGDGNRTRVLSLGS